MHFAHGNQKRLTYGAGGSAPALGARPLALNALLVLTTSNENNNLGSLLQAELQSPKQKGFRHSRRAGERLGQLGLRQASTV